MSPGRQPSPSAQTAFSGVVVDSWLLSQLATTTPAVSSGLHAILKELEAAKGRRGNPRRNPKGTRGRGRSKRGSQKELNQMPSVSSMIKDAIAAEGSDLKDTNYRTRHSSSGTRHFSSDCKGPTEDSSSGTRHSSSGIRHSSSDCNGPAMDSSSGIRHL